MVSNREMLNMLKRLNPKLSKIVFYWRVNLSSNIPSNNAHTSSIIAQISIKYITYNKRKHRLNSQYVSSLVSLKKRSILPERDYVTFGSLLSQIRLSDCLSVVCRLSVTFMRPTHGVEACGNISPVFTAVYLGHPHDHCSDLCAKFYRDHPRGPKYTVGGPVPLTRPLGKKITPEKCTWPCVIVRKISNLHVHQLRATASYIRLFATICNFPLLLVLNILWFSVADTRIKEYLSRVMQNSSSFLTYEAIVW